ncbi:MAG: asparagine synthetase B, partial [Candidatus Micrarchaeia archaeon]
MCGITGIFGISDKKLVKRMAASITHRGPDSEGYYVDENVSLGMRRLSIIDLKTGDQPVYDEKKNLIIFFNGEIYNYRELRAELKKKGHKFYTEGDTEAILHAYMEYGVEGIGKLNGMFAFAIYDQSKKKLILARDRAGIKPLYYCVVGDSGNGGKPNDGAKLVFGSEIKAILEYDGIERKLDKEALSSYLTYGTVLGDKTLFE